MAQHDEVRAMVREHYGKVATSKGSVGCAPSCCSPTVGASLKLGYSAEDLASVPEGSEMGLGCGNPQAIASLKAGETVLDLGSGGGFDCFLAARQVGANGHVIGVDMTPAMIEKARANAGKMGAANVEFRLGEIEKLPVDEGTVDVILSNCVVNLSPDKRAVFQEAFRVLKPGGRLAIADVVAIAPIAPELRTMAMAISGCVGGAEEVTIIEKLLHDVGFSEVRTAVKEESRAFIADWLPGSGAENYVASATIEAIKPGATKACCGPGGCG